MGSVLVLALVLAFVLVLDLVLAGEPTTARHRLGAEGRLWRFR